MDCFVSGFVDSTFLRVCSVARIADLWRLSDAVVSWDFSDIAFDVSINYPSCTYDDWYDLYFLIPHPLVPNLEIYILTHLLCGLLLDVVVTWYGNIYDDTLLVSFC